MYYQAVAFDYDGTLAKDGRVDEATVDALRRLKDSGRRLIMVSGREHADLLRVFPEVDLFDRLVLENGALLCGPGDAMAPLAEPPPPVFVERLREHGVDPLSQGEVIVSTWEPNETAVLDAIRDLGLEHQVIFNKGAVMVLPPGVNKASGLGAALEDLQLSAHNVVGIGDAENDVAFLHRCGCAVAVANALPSIKERADVVTEGARGQGVVEIAERLLANDLADVPTPCRHRIELSEPEADAHWPGRGAAVLIAGTSGSGKSTLVQAMLERLTERDYQFCIIDPEGDYDQLAHAFTVGSQDQPPAMSQVMDILEDPRANIAVNLLAIPLRERPDCFTDLLSRLLQLRLRRGRPHWVVVDEAHHMVSPAVAAHASELPKQLDGLVFVTVHADQLAPAALEKVKLVMAVGEAQDETVATFARQSGHPVPRLPAGASTPQTMMVWNVETAEARVLARPVPKGERRRHIRKYAEGQLGEDKSFYFRGPEDRLKLRAQNLSVFMQLAEGVDDETWLHHLRQGDYSRWFREAIKDQDLAREVAEAEAAFGSDASAS
ncbi:MAG TPA: HAD family hydrolase, partial [Rhodospirillales bacterium]|nr:HAD family hydrolase [Rhodospirillales bacterium]